MEIICINASFTSDTIAFYNMHNVTIPEEGNIYHVRGSENVRGKVGLFLEEIKNPDVPIKSILSGVIWKEPSFGSHRFTTLLGKPINIEELETVLEDNLIE